MTSEKPIIVADAMSVGHYDGDEGDSEAECQETGSVAASDDVQQETGSGVDDPRLHSRPAPRHGVIVAAQC